MAVNEPSRLAIDACIIDGSVMVTASGIPDFIVEIGEQLIWLGAALRSSPIPSGIVKCSPYVIEAPESGSDLRCIIGYNIEICQNKPCNTNGQCWHDLFANPVIAFGFPIPQRDQVQPGLDIPLDMMVALVRAQSISTFRSKVFIKGFSAMLVPTKQSGNLIIWHLLYNKNPKERISYLVPSPMHADVTVADLKQSRHIVGWCCNAVSIVGRLFLVPSHPNMRTQLTLSSRDNSSDVRRSEVNVAICTLYSYA